MAAAPSQAWKGFQLRRMDVPAQLDRRSVVLTHSSDGQVNLLNDSQWASPLPDEIVFGLWYRVCRTVWAFPQLANAAAENTALAN